MYYLKEANRFIENSYKILKKGERLFWREYFMVMVRTLLKVQGSKEKKIRLLGHTIRIPNNFIAFLVLQEIFISQLYKRIADLNHVLDLGGYIGDSGLYLASQNKKVTIVESDPRNFYFLEKNLKNKKNIQYYHAAIVADDSKDFFLTEDNEYRGTLSTEQKKHAHSARIQAISIEKILKENNFDGLKMDIEGGEYPIIEYCVNTGLFPFKKGFIEFHFFIQESENQKVGFRNFLKFLGSHDYLYELFDNAGKTIGIIDYREHLSQDLEKTEYINIYFEKKE